MKLFTSFFILFFSFITSYAFGQTASKKFMPDSAQTAITIDYNDVNKDMSSPSSFKIDEKNTVAYFNNKKYKLSEIKELDKEEIESIMIFSDEASAKEAMKKENTLVIIKNKPKEEASIE